MNHALRDYIEREAEPLEETLRLVLREVLPDSGEKPSRKTLRKRTGREKRAGPVKGRKK